MRSGTVAGRTRDAFYLLDGLVGDPFEIRKNLA
jgi:hypothetical protein